MAEIITIDGIPVSMEPTGMDNVPEISVSERIQEEKLSIQLWGEFLSGNLGAYTSGYTRFFPCNFTTEEKLKYLHFSLLKNADVITFTDYYGRNQVAGMIPEARTKSIYELLQEHTVYKGLRGTSFYFHEESLGYASYKLSKYHFSQSVCSQRLMGKRGQENIADNEQQMCLWHCFEAQFPHNSHRILDTPDCKMVDHWMVMIFHFTNEIEQEVMSVVKLYGKEPSGRLVKFYYPQSYLYCREIGTFSVMTGLQEHQLLFQLHRVIKAQTVVICPTLENALALQQSNDVEEIAFTAFVCDDGHFEQIDWSPLTGKSVKLLIVNHSGKTLAECYLETRPLCEYLKNEAKIENIGFLQMEVRYPDSKLFYDFNTLLAAHCHQKPEIVENSVMELTEDGFNAMYPRAEAEIQRKFEQSQDKAFWCETEKSPAAEKSSENANLSQLERIIWRPFIVRGQITVIVSAPSVGKSCITTAICAQLAGSNAPFLEERCLIPCTPRDNPQRRCKVLYAVFDNDRDFMKAHHDDFANDLGENDCNFIQQNMVGDMTDYTQESNYTAFTRWLNSFRQVGTPDQPVDVLVIDTFLEFAHGNVNNVHLMLRKLISDYPNMAIILVHHLNKADETYGGIKSTMLPRVILKLYRTKEQQEAVGDRIPTLCDPFTMAVDKFNANKIPEDGESFALKLDEHNHFVVVNPVRSKAEMYKCLIENYQKKYGADQKTIACLLGTTDRTIRNWKNAPDKQ